MRIWFVAIAVTLCLTCCSDDEDASRCDRLVEQLAMIKVEADELADQSSNTAIRDEELHSERLQVLRQMTDEQCALPTTSLPDSATSGQRVSAEIGCSETSESANPYWESRWGFDESLDCVLDGEPTVRVHTFDGSNPERAKFVRGQLTTRTIATTQQPFACPDGTPFPAQWVVIGPDWAVVTSVEDHARHIAARLDGEFVGGGEPDEGPPVSYPPLGSCPTET